MNTIDSNTRHYTISQNCERNDLIHKYLTKYLLDDDRCYAFTINPIMDPHRSTDIDPMFYDTVDYYYYIDKIHADCRYAFSDMLIVPELSESKEKLHFHGFVIIKDLIKWYRTAPRSFSEMGFNRVTKLKTYQDAKNWMHYITKDMFIAEERFGQLIEWDQKEILRDFGLRADMYLRGY